MFGFMYADTVIQKRCVRSCKFAEDDIFRPLLYCGESGNIN